MKGFEYYQPKDLDEAFSLMERFNGDARYIAGGTDLLLGIKQKVIDPGALISLRGIHELKGIDSNSGLTLGSMTLFRDMERDPNIARKYPVIKQAVSHLANPQIRNVATVGGNLCNAAPSGDCAPPLLVLEALLTLQGPGGTREVPVKEFFKGPGETCMEEKELLTRIKVPKRAKETGMAFLKMGRAAQDIAIVNAAVLLIMEGEVCKECRLAVGAVAPVPLRLKGAESIVRGQVVGGDLLVQVSDAVEKEVSPITDVRSTEEYRRALSGVLIKRAIKQALNGIKDII